MSLSVVVDLCVIPMGGDVSVAKEVKQCVDIIKASGLTYRVHGYGTNIEGEWDAVFAVVKACHEQLHDSGVARISSTLRVGTRIDKQSSIADKIEAVS
jgi:uncharacterized protein (TIGR00106 family)